MLATNTAAGGPQVASQRPRPPRVAREVAVTGPRATASSGPVRSVSTLTGAPSDPPTSRMRPPYSLAPPQPRRQLAGQAGEALVEAQPGRPGVVEGDGEVAKDPAGPARHHHHPGREVDRLGH